jgi:hypothetical protein
MEQNGVYFVGSVADILDALKEQVGSIGRIKWSGAKFTAQI